MKHKLYILTFNKWSYDQYDELLVSADSEKECEEIVKKEYPIKDIWNGVNWKGGFKIRKIGESDEEEGIIMDSYNAG